MTGKSVDSTKVSLKVRAESMVIPRSLTNEERVDNVLWFQLLLFCLSKSTLGVCKTRKKNSGDTPVNSRQMTRRKRKFVGSYIKCTGNRHHAPKVVKPKSVF